MNITNSVRSCSRRMLAALLLSMLFCCPAFADLTGTYVDDNGNKVEIVQNQQRLTIRVHGPRGLQIYDAKILPAKIVKVPAGTYREKPPLEFEFVDDGITYKGSCYNGMNITVRSSVKYLSAWKRVRTPVEGPGAVRLDPNGKWMAPMTPNGSQVQLTIESKGEVIRISLIDFNTGARAEGKGRWLTTNSFEFSVNGYAGKTLCKLDWGQRRPGDPRTPLYQLTSDGPMGHTEWIPWTH